MNAKTVRRSGLSYLAYHAAGGAGFRLPGLCTMNAQTVYRALLYCYPAAFRHEYGSQMQLMFVDQLVEAKSRFQQARLWLHAASDALFVAPKEHWHVILQDLRYAW